MKISEAIAVIDSAVPNAQEGLPNEIFLLASRLVPMVNVDLLIQDENQRTLLSWRDDMYAGRGWHVPGGILRYQEDPHSRINKVAETEIGQPVSFNPEPIAFNHIVCSHQSRGHFISLLYQCTLPSNFIPDNLNRSFNQAGYLKWHSGCPNNMIQSHEIYRDFIEK